MSHTVYMRKEITLAADNYDDEKLDFLISAGTFRVFEDVRKSADIDIIEARCAQVLERGA